jgi:hypothetical protein
MDVAAIVPKTATTTEPIVYKRKDKQWVLDEQILLDLKSATPPPIVKLDTKELLNDILKQVDGVETPDASKNEEPAPAPAIAQETAPTEPAQAPATATTFAYSHLINFWSGTAEAIIAAGGLDRNRGNAEQLRHYWVHGEGAAKIRWGQPGDWKRCVRHLAKHLGPRAKGYCQLRHKEALGIYTATHAKRDRNRG